jgi:acetyl esterase
MGVARLKGFAYSRDVRSWLRNSRKRVGSKIIEGFFAGSARIARAHPRANPAVHNVEVLRDIAYGPGAHERLDVYRPLGAPADAARPSLLYVHGGGFRILSKDTHWVMGLAFAKRGYTVYSINYRLAEPFPAALIDTCKAYAWVIKNATTFGSDPRNLLLAGESAGGNLVTALTLALCMDRPEPWLSALGDERVVPRAVVPFCGMFQVSNVERLWRTRAMSAFLRDRLEEIERGYLSQSVGSLGLADPVCILESDVACTHALPPFFLSVGTRDPLITDTERMAEALSRRNVPHAMHVYEGEFHAFQAFVVRQKAKQCWADLDLFRSRYDV